MKIRLPKFLILFLGFVLTGCDSITPKQNKNTDISSFIDEEGKLEKPLDQIVNIKEDKDIQYEEYELLAKLNKEIFFDYTEDKFKKLGVLSIEEHRNSPWITIHLDGNHKADQVIDNMRSFNEFLTIDYNYIISSSIEEQVTTSYDQTDFENAINLKEARQYLKYEGYSEGGSKDVVVAVLDTGVDYNHIDLRDNIWTNTGEIPGNGIDDDGNGYVDDIRGWNCVGDNNDPLDDNGHGTHVSGIIASEKNDFGTTGIAYNVKIMPVKCGNSSNSFNYANIAEGIRYAYMNGADIINMSIGGSSLSIECQEALEDAYTSSFLVASAGNDRAQNELRFSGYKTIPTYPAALPYVCGVMAENNQHMEAWFSNFDVFPHNKIEYEVFAPGVNILSTFPNGKYASLNGTSMSAPVISGIAALIRSAHMDKEVYPTKYIFSQITNTSKTAVHQLAPYRDDLEATCVDAYSALATASNPNIIIYNSYTFDNKSYSSKNNGDGTINAGETINAGLELKNLGGAAYNTITQIDVERAGGVKDPYIEITNNTISFDTIGTYSNKDTGIIFDENKTALDTQKAFTFTIAENCPDEYYCSFNVKVSCLDGSKTAYEFNLNFGISVSNRILLPSNINTDTTLTKEHSYLLLQSMVVMKGVTLTIEPGVDIQMYNDLNTAYEQLNITPSIIVWGTLNAIGSEQFPINIHNADWHINSAWYLKTIGDGTINLKYCRTYNFINNNNNQNINADFCELTFYSTDDNELFYTYEDGEYKYMITTIAYVNQVKNSRIILKAHTQFYVIDSEKNVFEYSIDHAGTYWGSTELHFDKKAKDTIIYNKNEDTDYRLLTYFYFYGTDYDYDNLLFLLSDNSQPIAGFVIKASGYGNDGDKVFLKNTVLKGVSEKYLDYYVNDFYDGVGNLVIETSKEAFNEETLFPYVKEVKILDENGNEINTVNTGIFSVKVLFNVPMDTEKGLRVGFGSRAPFADYSITGNFISETEWVGQYQIKSTIEGGTNFFNISDGYSLKNHLKLVENGHMFSFVIDIIDALSMNLQAEYKDDGVHLSISQDDFEESTIMGFNIYRYEEKDGQATKINPTILTTDEKNYIDRDVISGKTYYYQFTTVFTDLSESSPSEKVMCSVKDITAPLIIHTPINQGYLGSNLIITCLARDNVSIVNATLYYREKGNNVYERVTMSKSNETYSGKINASSLSIKGLEYYIEVSDGTNTITKGSRDNPYEVVIKSESALEKMGDIDSDGIVTSKDALLVMQALEGKIVLKDDQFKKADINKNNKLESIDALYILKYVTGSVTSLDTIA